VLRIIKAAYEINPALNTAPWSTFAVAHTLRLQPLDESSARLPVLELGPGRIRYRHTVVEEMRMTNRAVA
jgi:hypothetical protein